ncbi:Fimbrial assembly protein (PilN) (plasmid) [Legionella adelaidensis]|uniref:Fimbrial assembly protein (PilN) n=1 Tax=Legionella adelaidensis TaxID=45056 RepID=A0A0W0R0L5_9GAMM|nr:PilN domain-containing protein [Legionella adelaidensis]KTC64614.1 Fimbrial assembly protein (PilN) [Legionella adelaidensis]VEH86081.1 Fimbrial assembly protein (PilN) [Legionella adelaidensis]
MIQDINFLNFLPQKKDFLNANHILISSLALIILLIIASISLGINQGLTHSELEKAQKRRAQAEIAFQQVTKTYPLLTIDKPLVNQVSELESMLQKKQEQFGHLTHATLRKPFSHYLQTLTRVVPNGLWLTNIRIDQDTQNVSITGVSLQPLFVSVLMQSLQSAASFADIQFDLFYVKKLKHTSYIEFEIANDQLTGASKKAKEINR